MRTRRTTWTRRALPLALTAVLAVGCGNGEDDPETALERPSPSTTASPTPSPSPSPSPTTGSASPTGDARQWASCVSTRGSLQVEYPQDWTARDRPDGGCAYFDPEPFEVERGTEGPSVAVRLDVESVAYDRVRQAYLDGEVISQRETTVAGYDAIRVEDRDTEGPLAPKGHRLTYIADLGQEKTLVLTTNETDAEDFQQAQEVLDEMAERLERTG